MVDGVNVNGKVSLGGRWCRDLIGNERPRKEAGCE